MRAYWKGRIEMESYCELTVEEQTQVDRKVVAARAAAIVALAAAALAAALDAHDAASDDAGAADSQTAARAAVITARNESIKRIFKEEQQS